MKELKAYREEFPVTGLYTYFNHASVSPLPRRSAQAMQSLIEDVMRHGAIHYPEWQAALDRLRQAAARLIGSEASEIAVVKNTSEGLSAIANGIAWRAGDVVVGIEDEFPANYFPWERLRQRGVDVRWLTLREGRIELEEIERACKGARLLAISYVQYVSGFRIDLDAVGEICRRSGTLLVVDAVQGLGPFPVDVKRSGIHALAASGHKWLLGPEGCGILFVDRGLIPKVEPIEFGWTNVAGWRTYSRDPSLRPDAARYECGTLNTVGTYGLAESTELFLEVGVGRIARHIDQLIVRLLAGAAEKGYRPLALRTTDSGSGIVSIRKEGVDSETVVRRLMENRVITSLRGGCIRASPHFYATEEDVDLFVELLL
jgi:selenocysteine lyase/cysteine desulfurase